MTIPDTSWMLRAACRGCDPALFFPEQGCNAPQARAVCAGCEVNAECLAYGLWEREGVYGGKTARERKLVRRGTHGKPRMHVGGGDAA